MWGLQTTRESLNSTVNTSASWSEQALRTRLEMMSGLAAFLMHFLSNPDAGLGNSKSSLYVFFRGTLFFFLLLLLLLLLQTHAHSCLWLSVLHVLPLVSV